MMPRLRKVREAEVGLYPRDKEESIRRYTRDHLTAGRPRTTAKLSR